MRIRISSRTQLALLAYICMIMNGRKDMARYVVLFGRCVTIIQTLTGNIIGNKQHT